MTGLTIVYMTMMMMMIRTTAICLVYNKEISIYCIIIIELSFLLCNIYVN